MARNKKRKLIILLLLFIFAVFSIVVFHHHVDSVTEDRIYCRETNVPLGNNPVVGNVDAYAKVLQTQSVLSKKDGDINETKLPRMTKLRVPVENKSIVYDVNVLHAKLLEINSALYNMYKTTNSEYKLRDPKCVVLGVEKSGTQELVDFASLHPNIVLKPGLSPPEMFSMDETKRRQTMQNDKYPVPCSYADQIVIAKTDLYLFYPEMPQILHRFNPDLKMILIVREPVARMISGFTFHFLQQKQQRDHFIYNPEDVPEMDKWFVDQSNGDVVKHHELHTSTYYAGLERYLKVFPLEQILVIGSNEFKTDPVRVLQKVERFLNLKPVFTEDVFTFVKEKGFYCLNSDKIYCYGSDRGRAVMRELRPETKLVLKSYFKPLNKKFFELIGRTLDW